jgi:3-octaprenyl-4-hydroxybenzoate carboxy-lyase
VIEKDIKLFDILPLFRLNRGDGGYYIDKACTISRDPDDWDNDDVENVGVYRLMVQGPRRIAIQTFQRSLSREHPAFQNIFRPPWDIEPLRGLDGLIRFALHDRGHLVFQLRKAEAWRPSEG